MSQTQLPEIDTKNVARHKGDFISRGRAALLILLVGLGSGLAIGASVALSPLLNSLMGQYNASLSEVSWTLTIASIAGAVAAVILPRLSDSSGDKRMLLVGALALVVGALLCAIIDNLFGLIVGQALIGFGGISSFIGVTMVRRQLKSTYAAPAVAALTVGSGVGLAVGYVIGGLALEVLTLQQFFWANAGIFALFLIALVVFVPKDHHEDVDPLVRAGSLGTILLSTAVVLLLLAFAQGPAWGWTDWRILLIAAAAVVVAIVWVAHERKTTMPVFDRELIKNPAVRGVVAGLFLINAVFFIWLVLAPTFLQMPPELGGYGLGLSPLQAGLAMLPEAAAHVIGVTLAANGLKRGRGVLGTGIGALAAAAGLAWLAFFQGGMLEVIIGFVIFGFGFGTFGTSAIGVLQLAVPESRAGMAMSLTAVTTSLGAGFGAPVAAVVLASFSLPDGPPSVDGFLPAYLVAAGLAIIAGVVALDAYRRTRT